MKKIAILIAALLLTACAVPPKQQGLSNSSLPINIKQGMEYTEARTMLVNTGWQTITMHKRPNGTPVCWANWEGASTKASCRYEEIYNCSGTGMGFCKMWFFDGDKKYLMVLTNGGEPLQDMPNGAFIDSWFIEDTPPEIEVRSF